MYCFTRMNALATARGNDSPSWGVRKAAYSDIQHYSLNPRTGYSGYTRVLYSLYARGINPNRLLFYQLWR